MKEDNSDIRESKHSGTMYEANPEMLKAKIEELLAAATATYTVSDDKTLKALIVPHGPLDKSGATAAEAYINI